MAEDGVGFLLEWSVICAVETVGSRPAMDLMVEMLEGNTRVGRSHVLGAIETCLDDAHTRRFLLGNESLKPAVLPFASSRSWLQRSQFADIAASAGWKDAVPLIRNMVQDDNLSLRETAARALHALTGETVEIDRPARSFPSQEIVPGLLRTPRRLDVPFVPGHRMTCFTVWFDGRPVMISGIDRAFAVLDADLAPRERIETGHFTRDMLGLPLAGGGRQLVSLVSDEVHGGPEFVASFDARGRDLWTYRMPRSGIESAAFLHGQDGPAGVVVASRSGIVALDLAGEALWTVTELVSSYGVRSHPRLPGRILTYYGRVHLLEASGEQVRVVEVPTSPRVYCIEALLFPDAQGEPAVIVAGSASRGDRTAIARVDASGENIWSATLSADIEGMVLIEPANRERLFVATTSVGDLLLFNDQGVLRFADEMPSVKKGDRAFTFSLVAGRVDADEWGFVLDSEAGTHFYTVDASLLEERD